ncbi:hypothetical protein L7F22_032507 [Adiantum nelumboides]|nr:hypothetical protein [Adiantum nelumboides]
MRDHYNTDEDFAESYDALVRGEHPDSYSLKEGSLMFRGKLCVSRLLQQKVMMTESHSPPYAGLCAYWPGKEELFVDLEELRARLRNWLENWPGRSLPSDLAGFENLDDAVTYLVENACELDITDGSGTVKWFGVRL